MVSCYVLYSDSPPHAWRQCETSLPHNLKVLRIQTGESIGGTLEGETLDGGFMRFGEVGEGETGARKRESSKLRVHFYAVLNLKILIAIISRV